MTARTAPPRRAFRPHRILPFAILLAAFALRAWQLMEVPPGLTHDEAGHGHDAAHILKGIRPIYFTVGSGREPLFDYVNAVLMAGMGVHPFTLRFSAAVFGMIALAGTHRVARMVFDRRTAWLALALMAVSFWPLMSGRQILRSAMLPGEMAIAVIFFLKLTRGKQTEEQTDNVIPAEERESSPVVLAHPPTGGLRLQASFGGNDSLQTHSKANRGDFTSRANSTPAPRNDRMSVLSEADQSREWWWTLALALAIAASLYTYIPARALWLMFPAAYFTHYVLRLTKHSSATAHQSPTPRSASYGNPRPLLSIPFAFLLASPLFLYLFQHPEAEQRIGMLSEPLKALRNGDLSLLLTNAREFFLAFFLPGYGDHFLAYTIPGRPLFDLITFLLFMIGLVLLIRRAVISDQLSVISDQLSANSRASQGSQRLLMTDYWLLIYWLLFGLAPSLITGPEAMTTRIIGAQPVLYILPALGLVAVGRWLLVASRWSPVAGRWSLVAGRLPIVRHAQRALVIGHSTREAVIRRSSFVIASHLPQVAVLGLFIVSLFIATARDYFVIWGQSPDVRAAYQSTLIAMLKTIEGPTVISTVYPSAPHDPYIGELITDKETRWVDGRLALLLPEYPNFQLLVPSSTPLHSSFSLLATRIATTNLRPNDLDPAFTVYQLAPRRFALWPEKAVFNDSLALVDYFWSGKLYRPGDVAEITTIWHVLDPSRLGPLHPPAFKTDLNLFTHVLSPDGSIFLQQDRLDAPSWDWQAGDVVIQIHQFAIPPDAAPGEYQVEVGLYDRVTGERLLTQDGTDHLMVVPLIIQK